MRKNKILKILCLQFCGVNILVDFSANSIYLHILCISTYVCASIYLFLYLLETIDGLPDRYMGGWIDR